MSRRLAWGLVAVHLLVASYGFYLNDEADQISAMHNLANGSLRIQEHPASAYQLADNITWQPRWEDDRPVASTPLNVLALLVLPMVRFAAALAPLSFWFSGLAAVSLWRAAGRPAPWQASSATSALVFLALWLALGAGLRSPGPDATYYTATLALNFTGILLGIVGSLLAWKVLGRHVQGGWQFVLLAALVVGPWLFWARAAKYHMLSAVLILGILLLLQRPRSTGRDVGIGLVAGLAFWTNFGVGVVAILGIATLEVVRLGLAKGRRRIIARAWGPLVSGGLLGILPALVENHYLFGNPLTNFYFASPETSSGSGATQVGNQSGGQAAWNSLQSFPGLVRHLLHWQGPGDFAANLASVLTLGTRLEGGPAFGIFLVSPLLLFSVWGAWRVFHRSRRTADAGFALALLSWQILLATNASVRHGAGFDARLWFHTLPAFALLAAVGVRSLPPIAARRALAGAALIALLPFATMRVVSAMGYRFSGPEEVRLAIYGTAIVGLCLILGALATHILKGRPWQRPVTAVAVAAGLAMPMVWTAFFALASPLGLPTTDGHAGGTMYVLAMDHVTHWLHDTVFPPTPMPLVWDPNGTLVYHPDHGSCLVDPNPCPDLAMPEALRQRLAALNETEPAF